MFLFFFVTEDSAKRALIKKAALALNLAALLLALCACSAKMPWEVPPEKESEQNTRPSQETTVAVGNETDDATTGHESSEPEREETTDETTPYWTYEYSYEMVDGEMISDEPGRHFIPDEVREQTISYFEEGYRFLKDQKWTTSEADPWTNGNIAVLCSALEELPMEKRTPPTYAEMRVAVVNRDIDQYYGDLMNWAGVKITGVTEYQGDSPEAQKLHTNQPFCIVTAKTVHEEEIMLFVMDSSRIHEFYQVGINSSIRGYPVGTLDQALVICVVGLYGG